MDIILLNETFKNEEYVDTHESFIWREAFFGGDGDFELTMSKADSDASPMAIGRILTHSETNRMCVVDTLEEEEDDEGVVVSTWKGVDFTRWIFSRRVVQRTVMPTYSWSKAPHNSVSIETYKGAISGRNNFINPHFVMSDSDTVEPHLRRSSPFAEDSVTGNLRVGNGVVALTGVTTDNEGQRGYGYKMARQLIPVGHRYTRYTFSITVEDVNLSPGGRIQVYIEFYNANYALISSMTSYMPGIYTDGTYSITTPSNPSAPSFYDVYFIIDNRQTTAYPSIEDCSATFHSPVLTNGTTPGQFFAGDMSYLMLHPERKFSGLPSNIMNDMVRLITRNNTDIPKDNIATTQGFPPGLDGYGLGPKNLLPAETADLYFGAVSLYDALLSVGETYDLGVSIMRDNNGALFSYAHGGTDRRNRIIYDPNTDTLDNPSSVETMRDHRTHAIVYGKYDFVITDAAGSITSHEDFYGYDREMLVVQASDVDLPHGTEELYSVLIQRGREALNEHQRVSGIDGEVPSHVEYKYQRDFGLGSMVTVRNDNGGEAEMRVTEYIFVSDTEGVRSYPTLSKNRYIDPGTWEASRPSELWNNAVGFWEDR